MSRPGFPGRLGRALLLLCSLVLMFATVVPPSAAMAGAPGPRAEIDPNLIKEAEKKDTGPEQALLVLADKPAPSGLTGGRSRVVGELKRVATASQAKVGRELARRSAKLGGAKVLNSFWLKNMMLVELDSSTARLEEPAAIPGVEKVTKNFKVEPLDDDPIPETASVLNAARTSTRGSSPRSTPTAPARSWSPPPATTATPSTAHPPTSTRTSRSATPCSATTSTPRRAGVSPTATTSRRRCWTGRSRG
jgi:hypothetical protein